MIEDMPARTPPSLNNGALRATKRARRFAGIYIAISVGMYLYFEWYSAHHRYEGNYSIMDALFILPFLIIALVRTVMEAWRINFVAASIYFSILCLMVGPGALPHGSYYTDFMVKAYIVHSYPWLCPLGKVTKSGATICEAYTIDNRDYDLIIDNSNKISAPFGVWYPSLSRKSQKEFIRVLYGKLDDKGKEDSKKEVFTCGWKRSRRLAYNVYYTSNSGCWHD